VPGKPATASGFEDGGSWPAPRTAAPYDGNSSDSALCFELFLCSLPCSDCSLLSRPDAFLVVACVESSDFFLPPCFSAPACFVSLPGAELFFPLPPAFDFAESSALLDWTLRLDLAFSPSNPRFDEDFDEEDPDEDFSDAEALPEVFDFAFDVGFDVGFDAGFTTLASFTFAEESFLDEVAFLESLCAEVDLEPDDLELEDFELDFVLESEEEETDLERPRPPLLFCAAPLLGAVAPRELELAFEEPFLEEAFFAGGPPFAAPGIQKQAGESDEGAKER
jgi:hypothetical protein